MSRSEPAILHCLEPTRRPALKHVKDVAGIISPTGLTEDSQAKSSSVRIAPRTLGEISWGLASFRGFEWVSISPSSQCSPHAQPLANAHAVNY